MEMQKKLSREEMKAITGGKLACNCQCNGAGTWSASYSSASAAYHDLQTYCSGGGSCQCTEPAS